MSRIHPVNRRIPYDAPAIVAFVLGLLLVACDQGPVTVQALIYDSDQDDYVFTDTRITTLDDLTTLDGRATRLLGGASLTLDYIENNLLWHQQGWPVSFSSTQSDGVRYPTDFDSLAMVSIYYSIEQAMLFFESAGMPPGLPGRLSTYYWPSVKVIEYNQFGLRDEYFMKDNAFYLPSTINDKGFYVFPFEEFQLIPMSMNQGILSHEYSHAVFDVLIVEPWGLNDAEEDVDHRLQNFVYGLNEGWADFMSFALTGDPDFMAHSIPRNTYYSTCNSLNTKDVVRDMSVPFVFDRSMDSAARNSDYRQFCPYDVGSFVASTLYEITRDAKGAETMVVGIPDTGRRLQMAQVVYQTMAQLGQEGPGGFELWDFFRILIEQLDPMERSAACDVLNDRYAIYYSEVEGC